MYLSSLASNKFGFLITKYCGYEFFIMIHKHSTLKELFRYIELETGNSNFRLYVNELEISKTYESLNNYIIKLRNDNLLEPIYKIPNPVVYRIMIDDGHKH
tara:strand:- start:3996 stop:4298 length:303 start_codon:yes stop_codon:yes gene_type:complete